MLRHLCHRSRLQVLLNKDKTGDSAHELVEILCSEEKHKSGSQLRQLDEQNVADILRTAKKLDHHHYNMLLHYLHSMGQPWHTYDEIPPPLNHAWILPRRAQQPYQIDIESRTYSCQKSHEGNSSIAFYNPHNMGSQSTGFIQAIWQIPLNYVMQTFFLVNIHQDLPIWDNDLAPYSSHPRLGVKLIDAQPSGNFYIIEPRHIITHLTMFKRPAGTYGFQKEIISVCWSLNRGRK